MEQTAGAIGKSYRWRRHLAAMFGVKLTGDIPERLIGLSIPVPLNKKRRQRLASIRSSGVLFIHIPKNAGTSLSMALYGHVIRHDTIRYYEHVAPEFMYSAITVAIMRNPVERFISAYRFAKSGGTAYRQVSAPFRSKYMSFQSIESALECVENSKTPFEVDHIFRPQSWYITDRVGRLAVQHLVDISDLAQLQRLLPNSKIASLPQINRSHSPDVEVSALQRARICRIYQDDVALWEELRAGKTLGTAVHTERHRLVS